MLGCLTRGIGSNVLSAVCSIVHPEPGMVRCGSIALSLHEKKLGLIKWSPVPRPGELSPWRTGTWSLISTHLLSTTQEEWKVPLCSVRDSATLKWKLEITYNIQIEPCIQRARGVPCIVEHGEAVVVVARAIYVG